jgi:hypothetical protein
MIITKEHQESWVNAYVKEKHTTDECIGFIDGIEKALNFVQEKMKPTQKQKLEEYIWSKIFPNEELNYDEFYDWSAENANKAFDLSIEFCRLNGI